jgi:hypothetical protein
MSQATSIPNALIPPQEPEMGLRPISTPTAIAVTNNNITTNANTIVSIQSPHLLKLKIF